MENVRDQPRNLSVHSSLGITMKPVLQLERTGCGIASVAAIAGLPYLKAKSVASSLGIHARDEALWSDTSHVRKLLRHFGFSASSREHPFRSWDALPDLALLSIKWHLDRGRPHWHWVVFVRQADQAYVLDSKKGLRCNCRTDFGRMRPKWFISVM
jgi:ABC-type bacteriocin/lantibiotic exporter with double-glycine peptidase domain